MKFAETFVKNSLGLILAHSIKRSDVRIKKGIILKEIHIQQLYKIGVEKIFTVKLENDDISENDAAKQIGEKFKNTENIRIGRPFSGRVNIFSDKKGVFNVNEKIINKLNSIHYSLTIATLANDAFVFPGQIIATIKIIPYGVKKNILKKFLKILDEKPFRIFKVKLKNISLIITEKNENTEEYNKKIIDSINHRLLKFGIGLNKVYSCAHEKVALSKLLKKNSSDLILIFLATATTDVKDVGPAAIKLIKGKIIRFGMPVDPGNLLFLAEIEQKKNVVGLPGCIKSKSFNGADWIIERLICGQLINNKMIYNMGVGGLLKEISTRPRPRIIESLSRTKKIDIILLAAGKSTRMGKEDKLLLKKNNKSLIKTSVEECLKVNINKVHVILGHNKQLREKELESCNVNICFFEGYEEGIGASIGFGMQCIEPDVDAVIISLADMPKIKYTSYLKLIKSFNENKNNEICRLYSSKKMAGHPILFSKRFFENLCFLSGDKGAKELIQESQEYLCKIYHDDVSPTFDIDKKKDYEKWIKE